MTLQYYLLFSCFDNYHVAGNTNLFHMYSHIDTNAEFLYMGCTLLLSEFFGHIFCKTGHFQFCNAHHFSKVLCTLKSLICYSYNRLDYVRETRWQFGCVLPIEVKQNLSEHEVNSLPLKFIPSIIGLSQTLVSGSSTVITLRS